MPRWFSTPGRHLQQALKSSLATRHDATAEYVKHYQLLHELGYGSSGIVYLALDTQTNKHCAIKELSRSRLRQRVSQQLRWLGPRTRPDLGLGVTSQDSLDHGSSIKRRRLAQDTVFDASLIQDLDHVNIAKLIEVIEEPDSDAIYLVMEAVEKGPVIQLVPHAEAEPLPSDSCAKYFAQMVDAVDYLHNKGIVHGDIKPDNILLSDDDQIKIIDFGSFVNYRDADSIGPRPSGTPAFMAPELIRKNVQGDYCPTASDIWALGVTLYCMRYGKLPFDRPNLLDLYEDIQHKSVTFPSDEDPDLCQLLERMLAKNPCERITMDEIKQHPWVTKHKRPDT